MKSLSVAPLLLVLACKSEPTAPPQPLPAIDPALDAVRSEFNAHASEPRFVTLLSAT
jgi:hypothetical protein